MKLSVILTGRDDNYGENFIERLNQCLDNNIRLLNKNKIDYEIICVDFNPIDGKYLHNNEVIKEKLSQDKIKNIIIDNSVIIAENLSPSNYYEYFAKNAGVRRSIGDFLFMTNSDILFSNHLIQSIKNIMETDVDEKYFYRVRYRGEIELETVPDKNTELVDVHMQHLPDACICGMYSGDASMFPRKVMIEIATGYDEKEQRHRTNAKQSSMDGEILWNCFRKGKTLKFLESPYYHVAHERPDPRDSCYNQHTYENDESWGFVNYKEKFLNKNTIFIYA